MPRESLLDYLPLPLLFVLTVSFIVGAISVGFFLAERRVKKLGEGAEKPKPGAVGTTLGLLAFLLAFNFNLAAGRYEKRSELVQQTATSIRSAQLYAERLPGEETEAFRLLLKSYVDDRLSIVEQDFEEYMASLNSLLDRIWVTSGEIAAANPSNPNSRLLLMAANTLIQNHEKAIWSSLYNRIPPVTWAVLYLMVLFGMLALGYEAGLAAARYRVVTSMLALCFATVLLLVAALDRPGNSLIKIDVQSLQDVQAFLRQRLLESGVVVEPPPEELDSGIALYAGGPILTMLAGDEPAEAIAVRDGLILAVGTRAEVLAVIGEEGFDEIDLGGRTLLPGFIDAHSHLSDAVRVATWANLAAAPMGEVRSERDLLDTLRAHGAELGDGKWVFGFGYDPDALDGDSVLTVRDLDPLFPERPVVALLASGDGAVLNSAALSFLKVGEETEEPEGGLIGRLPGSNQPNGLLLGEAWNRVRGNLPKPTESARFSALGLTLDAYAANGYTTCHDGASTLQEYDFLRGAASAGQLSVDVVSVLLGSELERAIERSDLQFGTYAKRLKPFGVKALLDGSSRNLSAYFTEPYLVDGPDGESEWTGEPSMSYEEFLALFQATREAGLPLFTHVDGDAAIDMLIRAHRDSGVTATDDWRSVAVHSQFARPDQLDAFKELGITPSFFSGQLYFWGDQHLVQLGEARAGQMNPLAAAKARGVRYSNHTDAITTPLDPMMTLWTAVARKTRAGVELGSDQAVPVAEALRALTIDAAWQIREEREKGTLVPGKVADFTILSANPLTTSVDNLRGISVKQTIKDGRVVYSAD